MSGLLGTHLEWQAVWKSSCLVRPPVRVAVARTLTTHELDDNGEEYESRQTMSLTQSRMAVPESRLSSLTMSGEGQQCVHTSRTASGSLKMLGVGNRSRAPTRSQGLKLRVPKKERHRSLCNSRLQTMSPS